MNFISQALNGWTLAVFPPAPSPVVPTSDNVFEGLVLDKCDYGITIPAFIEARYRPSAPNGWLTTFSVLGPRPSKGGSSEDDAASGLIEELLGLETAIKAVPESFTGKLVLSVGATPTATASGRFYR